MSKKKRSKSPFSFFARLFKRNEEAYPAALDGRVTPWIPISNANSHRLKNNNLGSHKTVLRMKGFKTKQKKSASSKNIKLSSLEMQLKKMRLLVILKNNKPLKKITQSTIKTPPITGFVLNQAGVVLQHKTKILQA